MALLQMVVAIALATASHTGQTVGADLERAVAHQPGHVIGGPLVYRGGPTVLASAPPADTLIFRTRNSFAGNDDVGTTTPGAAAIEDSRDVHDGYQGSAYGKHCYGWSIDRTPRTRRIHVGQRIHVTLHLHKNAPETYTAKLRTYPRSTPGDGSTPSRPAALQRDLARIGCTPTN